MAILKNFEIINFEFHKFYDQSKKKYIAQKSAM